MGAKYKLGRRDGNMPHIVVPSLDLGTLIALHDLFQSPRPKALAGNLSRKCPYPFSASRSSALSASVLECLMGLCG